MISYAIPFLAAFIIGISKSGFKGMGMVIVTLMALAYGAKASTGILLPLLIFADILAVIYYNRYARWKYLLQFLPWMIGGILVAVFIGKDLPEDVFKTGMATIIITSVAFMFIWESYDKKNVPNQLWFIGAIGFSAGFATMIGNLAGAFVDVFFMATRIPKNEFIGTAAWLFFIVNLIKLPFHIFSWGTVNQQSLITDLYLIPAVILGFVIGVKVVKQFKNDQYRTFILIMTAIGGFVILLR